MRNASSRTPPPPPLNSRPSSRLSTNSATQSHERSASPSPSVASSYAPSAVSRTASLRPRSPATATGNSYAGSTTPVYSRRSATVGRLGSVMSDADIVSVFARKMGAVERLVQRTNADVQVPGSGDMKELHTRIADVAAQIKKEKYIEQLEAIEMRARSPLKADRLSQNAAAAAEAREALVPLWEQHPAAAETFRSFCTGYDRLNIGDWRRLVTEFQFENKFGLSERESDIIFHACSSCDDSCSEPSLLLSEFCCCLVQVAHLTSISARPNESSAASRQEKSRALGAICHFLQNPDAVFAREAMNVSQLGVALDDCEEASCGGASATSSDALFEQHHVWTKGMRGMKQYLATDADQLKEHEYEWTQRLEHFYHHPLYRSSEHSGGTHQFMLIPRVSADTDQDPVLDSYKAYAEFLKHRQHQLYWSELVREEEASRPKYKPNWYAVKGKDFSRQLHAFNDHNNIVAAPAEKEAAGGMERQAHGSDIQLEVVGVQPPSFVR